MDHTRALQAVSDDELLRRLDALVTRSNRLEADLVAHIGEVDERRLYARQAFPSMFAYCTRGLHLSEAEAYRRITVARAARKHELLLAMLSDGRLHLTGAALLAPLLTTDNCERVLGRAIHRTKRQIEELVAELSPRPDVPAAMTRLPRKVTATTSAAPEPERASGELVPERVADPARSMLAVHPGAGDSRLEMTIGMAPYLVPSPAIPESAPPQAKGPTLEPLSPGRYKVQFTASAELRDKLERLTALMRSEVPGGDLAEIVERAVTEKLERLEAKRYGRTGAPRTRIAESATTPISRHIPAAVRRAVHERDGSRCRFVDREGRRCTERHRLEFHHRHPFAMGGDHSPGNVSLLCPAHNRYLAEHDYGRDAIEGREAIAREPARTAGRLSRPCQATAHLLQPGQD